MTLPGRSFILCWVVLAWGSSATTGQQIRIGLAPFDYSPWFDFSGGANKDESLFIPAFLTALSERSSLQFTYVSLGDFPSDTYHLVAYSGLINDKCDVTFEQLLSGYDPDNIHKRYRIPKGVATFSVPMYTQNYWVLILKEQKPVNFLRFLEPFDSKLWLAVVVALFVISSVMVLIRVISPNAGEWGSFSAWFAVAAVYHTWAAFLGGEDYEWLTPSSKILRIALLFFILVSGATYTANLAAFFTKPSFRLVGPQNLQELSTSTVCVVFPETSYLARSYVKDVIFPPSSFSLEHGPRANWCIEQMRAGNAEAFFDQEVIAQAFLLQNCDRLARAQDIAVIPGSFVWIALRNRTEMLEVLNEAMLSFTGSPAYQELLINAFSIGRSCQDELIDSDTQKITLEQMKGFFVIFGIIVGIAVATAIVRAALYAITGRNKRDEKDHGAEGLTEVEMILQLSDKVDKVIREMSVRGQSSAPLSGEKDNQQNIAMRLTQQEVRTLEAETQIEMMKVRALQAEKHALEADKRAEALQRDLDVMKATAAQTTQAQTSTIATDNGNTLLPFSVTLERVWA